jgi:hypothetical protein
MVHNIGILNIIYLSILLLLLLPEEGNEAI